jgi:hypothetical protein
MAPLALFDHPLATPSGVRLIQRQETPAAGSGEPEFGTLRRLTEALPKEDQSKGGVFNVSNGSSAATSSEKTGERDLTASSAPTTSASMLDEAAAALQTVALKPNVAGSEWCHAARLLRSAALERRVVAPRIASVALLLADALTFTSPGDVSPNQRDGALKPGLRLLTQPFVSTAEEGGLVDALLDNGWDVMASFHAEAFGEFANAMTEGD